VSEEEAGEFLKLKKHSEYSVVEQLKKTLARISLMTFILSSEPRCNALQNKLNEVYVPLDMAQMTMEHLVEKIHAMNYLFIIEDELYVGGTCHNKHLYVTISYKHCTIDKALVDNGSASGVNH
jgi:hypothetical protein